MSNVAKRYLASLAERVVATFVLAGLGALDVTGTDSPATVSQLLQALAWNEKAMVAGTIAVLSLLKGIVARWAGNHNTPSLLPDSLDPATPPGQPG
jgi:hypothetical protein